ncbi:restriction endonuclease subunit S [Synechococcus sp. L2F]|uniref:restriction endonuclease subunit S n=1 Tax=Synechococcus sp. L2F TaxID=2823739 RepID=UPI0020CBF378|nr:restriction endonuclease subunit S [Synechococcus sp. L2F]MCP9827135.1 restriction endonuclease subunit S [Synechococcus sp. L2F]
MAGEWADLILGDLGRVVTGKTPLTAVEGNFGGQIPFVTPSDMDGRKTISTTVRNLTEAGAASVKGSKIPAGSVMVSCIGSDMGKAAIAGCDCVTNQQINSIVVDDRFCSEFIYYNLSTRKAEIRHQAAGGSAQPILNKGDFSRLEIFLPPLAEQKAIAAVLGALDDKIELNRRMNATLETMARALFQSWFVDFDPVRAKLDGRQPIGLDPDTAALFPSSFQASLLGLIPHGWKADTLKNRASRIQYGFTQRATEKPNGPHFLRITDIGGGRLDWASVPFCQATDEELEKYRIIDGDIFIARTGASTGESFYAVEPPQAVFASYLIRLQYPSRGIGRLVGEFARTPDYASYVAGIIGGSAQPNASAQALAGATMAFPTEAIADAFYRTVRPLDLMRAANDRESHALTTLRVTLLPKLLSGEMSAAG